MARWHAARTRIQLKLAIQRAHMLQEKKAALAKRTRLDIAELVGRGRMETARVRTESLILDDVRAATDLDPHRAPRAPRAVLRDALCAFRAPRAENVGTAH